MGNEPKQGSIGIIVHYESYGTPKGEYQSKCVAAAITQVNDAEGNVGLCVFNPSGLFFNQSVPHDQATKAPGTWHYNDEA